jgi:hypothetical protein
MTLYIASTSTSNPVLGPTVINTYIARIQSQINLSKLKSIMEKKKLINSSINTAVRKHILYYV